MTIRRADFPLPDTTDPVLAPFFEAAVRGELVIPRCGTCGAWCWYPRERCRECEADAFAWAPVRGTGSLFSWAVVRRPFLPAFADQVPFTAGLVAIDEDPSVRLVTTVVDADPAELVAGQRMQVTFRALSFTTVPDRRVAVPMFRPAGPIA
ncbi:MAG: OB-fold domain-containing protein [Acidimicrobiia bacterium]